MTTTPLLLTRDLSVRYGRALALSEVSVQVPADSAVAVLGPNGAGKSTLARALSGLVRASSGTLELAGQDVTAASPTAIRRAGLVHLPEGRGVFRTLSVQENLRMATVLHRRDREQALQRV